MYRIGTVIEVGFSEDLIPALWSWITSLLTSPYGSVPVTLDYGP